VASNPKAAQLHGQQHGNYTCNKFSKIRAATWLFANVEAAICDTCSK